MYSDSVPQKESVVGGREDDNNSQSSLREESRSGFGVWREREFAVEVEYIEHTHAR